MYIGSNTGFIFEYCRVYQKEIKSNEAGNIGLAVQISTILDR